MNPKIRKFLVLTVLASLVFSTAQAADENDALDNALALEKLERADLGFNPRGYWSRYPADIPYKLRHFDALLEEPLATVGFTRISGNLVRNFLSKKALQKAPQRSSGALYQLAYGLGVERKFGAFRAYSANLSPTSLELSQMLLQVYKAAQRNTSFFTFGQHSPYPDYPKELKTKLAAVPKKLHQPLAQLIGHLLEAHRWVEMAFRRVPAEARQQIQQRSDLGFEITDALEYFPHLDDAAQALDEASLWYGALKAVAALDEARLQLEAMQNLPAFHLDWPTPLGWIRLRGTADDIIDADDSFLIVDFGGNDIYQGSAGASGVGHAVSVVIDIKGDDRYIADSRPAQGAGMGGVGLLLDLAGDDHYRATQCAQGFGQMGFGLLADLAGHDRYESRYSSQGAGIFGIGLLLEGAGTDHYQIESDGQGFGGSAAVGTLADYSGNDIYRAITDPKITERPSYHSKGKVAVSNAQGVGFGRRGDGADGHSYAGGLGQLIDISGDDHYMAGNWSMGTGYWFGTGLLYDGDGDDRYEGNVWSQGTGAHFCIGALIDEGGDDHHLIAEDGRNSLAFGHDFTLALLLNIGGNDQYESPAEGLGHALNRSYALFIDTAGDDSYSLSPKNSPANATFSQRLADRSGGATYFNDADSLALFLDTGGEDTYKTARAKNNSHWLQAPDSDNRKVRNLTIGVDQEAGTIDWTPRKGK